MLFRALLSYFCPIYIASSPNRQQIRPSRCHTYGNDRTDRCFRIDFRNRIRVCPKNKKTKRKHSTNLESRVVSAYILYFTILLRRINSSFAQYLFFFFVCFPQNFIFAQLFLYFVLTFCRYCFIFLVVSSYIFSSTHLKKKGGSGFSVR